MQPQAMRRRKESGNYFEVAPALSWMNLADATGIEPAISALTGLHVNHYTTRPLERNALVGKRTR